MNTITSYGLSDGENYYYSSRLCGVACSIDYPHNTQLSLFIQELCFSYFNQFHFVIDSYNELQQLHFNLNKLSDKASNASEFSDYDVKSIEIESLCRNYAYLLIISIKSLMDLIACLVDAVVNQKIREENKMVDLSSVNNKLKHTNIEPILTVMQRLLNKTDYPWLNIIKTCRDRLIHRGYRLKPTFGFKKGDDLFIKVVKGNFSGTDMLRIGQIFDDFIISLPQIEELISDTLLTIVPELSQGQLVDVHFKTGSGVTEYHFKEIL